MQRVYTPKLGDVFLWTIDKQSPDFAQRWQLLKRGTGDTLISGVVRNGKLVVTNWKGR